MGRKDIVPKGVVVIGHLSLILRDGVNLEENIEKIVSSSIQLTFQTVDSISLLISSYDKNF